MVSVIQTSVGDGIRSFTQRLEHPTKVIKSCTPGPLLHETMHASMHASVLYETDTDSPGTSNSPSYSLSAAWALATARPASPVYNPTKSISPDTSGNPGVLGSPTSPTGNPSIFTSPSTSPGNSHSSTILVYIPPHPPSKSRSHRIIYLSGSAHCRPTP